ncbi:PLC-like phosphodiesterase [Gymnopilus junonius]|uniref:PLC-like phosphodiesterase n=1 Tax=Gymnopilus junonius TaxID=109634 RepID=A0A9P5NIY5_GYMJU|nr:PLC-like phosphodiesterase [Gymnopilus junonius]
MSLRLAAFALFSLLLSSSVSAAPLAKRAQLCNGHAELCDRKYGNVTFLGSHDSFAFSGNPFALARTQEVKVLTQLSDGVRMLQAQSHMNNGKLHFATEVRIQCFVPCLCGLTMTLLFLFSFGIIACGLFDGGSVEDYLTKNQSVSKVWKPIFDKTGLTQMAYIPTQPVMSRDDWPTLGEMISSGKRVVIFLDKGAETRTEPAVEFILPQFQMVWEDVYDPTNSAFPCKVDRTAGPLAPSQQLSLINHNLNANIFPIGRGILIPDRLNSPKTNSINSILLHASHCAPYVQDRNPNFVMLDYVNVGQGLEAVNRLNGSLSKLPLG